MPCHSTDKACKLSVWPVYTMLFFDAQQRITCTAHSQAHNALMLGVTTNAVAAAANLLLSAHTHAMFSVAGKQPAHTGVHCLKGQASMHCHREQI